MKYLVTFKVDPQELDPDVDDREQIKEALNEELSFSVDDISIEEEIDKETISQDPV